MDGLRKLLEGRMRASATTAAAVLVLVQIFLPTIFDLMTGVFLVGMVWWMTRGTT